MIIDIESQWAMIGTIVGLILGFFAGYAWAKRFTDNKEGKK